MKRTTMSVVLILLAAAGAAAADQTVDRRTKRQGRRPSLPLALVARGAETTFRHLFGCNCGSPCDPRRSLRPKRFLKTAKGLAVEG